MAFSIWNKNLEYFIFSYVEGSVNIILEHRIWSWKWDEITNLEIFFGSVEHILCWKNLRFLKIVVFAILGGGNGKFGTFKIGNRDASSGIPKKMAEFGPIFYNTSLCFQNSFELFLKSCDDNFFQIPGTGILMEYPSKSRYPGFEKNCRRIFFASLFFWTLFGGFMQGTAN